VSPLGEGPLGRADLHLHTLASDGLMSTRALVDHIEHHTQLDVIAITDHDEIAASFEGRDYAVSQGYRVQVVTGVEVTTRDGHLLALFLEDRPPAWRPLQATAEWVREHGGLCIAPHPFTRWTHSLNFRAMRLAVNDGLIAGVEVLNASLAGRSSRPRALAFAEQHGLAVLGSSDAHMLAMVGLSRTRFPGSTPAELRHAIQTAVTEAEGRFATPREMATEALPQLARSMVHLPLRRIVRYVGARRAARSASR
jgi:predicted metal-dependent phosphoesterase TrpH